VEGLPSKALCTRRRGGSVAGEGATGHGFQDEHREFSRIFMKDRLNLLIRVAKLLQVVSGQN
jgi:hypothetical protein